jgi:hypothetical protein
LWIQFKIDGSSYKGSCSIPREAVLDVASGMNTAGYVMVFLLPLLALQEFRRLQPSMVGLAVILVTASWYVTFSLKPFFSPINHLSSVCAAGAVRLIFMLMARHFDDDTTCMSLLLRLVTANA